MKPAPKTPPKRSRARQKTPRRAPAPVLNVGGLVGSILGGLIGQHVSKMMTPGLAALPGVRPLAGMADAIAETHAPPTDDLVEVAHTKIQEMTMADKDGKTIDGSSGPSASTTSPDGRPMCVACGRYHGSVNEGRLCLENEIRRLRARPHGEG
jgi:hypothetical protein